MTVPVCIDGTTLRTDMSRMAIEDNGDGGILAAGTIQHQDTSGSSQ